MSSTSRPNGDHSRYSPTYVGSPASITRTYPAGHGFSWKNTLSWPQKGEQKVNKALQERKPKTVNVASFLKSSADPNTTLKQAFPFPKHENWRNRQSLINTFYPVFWLTWNQCVGGHTLYVAYPIENAASGVGSSENRHLTLPWLYSHSCQQYSHV